MKPHEIQPDTGLCTILGYNAQTGYMRKYFNKIMKLNELNATAIALNIKDEHFKVTMSSVGQSKVTQMMLEKDFAVKALDYCEHLNDCASTEGRVDFVEVVNTEVWGYCLDDEAKALFDKPEFLDDQILAIAKIMLIAKRWFGAKVDVNDIPMMINDKERE